jgi:hypothetical protein
MNNQAPERRRAKAKPENKRAAALEIGYGVINNVAIKEFALSRHLVSSIVIFFRKFFGLPTIIDFI